VISHHSKNNNNIFRGGIVKMNRCLLLRESRKLLNERNFSFSRHLQRVKFNKEVHDRKKQVRYKFIILVFG